MWITYEREADAAYVYLIDEAGHGEAVTQIVVHDERLAGEIVLDLDAAGRLLGVEVLGASSILRPETLGWAQL